jgi:hypothetical protein
MNDEIARVTKVSPAGGRVLHVRFAGDRRDHRLDLTGLIARSEHFAPLMDDAEAFAKVSIVEDGLGVAWPIETKWENGGASMFQRQRRSGSLRRRRDGVPSTPIGAEDRNDGSCYHRHLSLGRVWRPRATI